MNYQRDYSIHFPATKNTAKRQRKAIKIREALLTYLNRRDLNGLQCLDIGCSVGIISQVLASAGGNVTGIDIDLHALQTAQTENSTATTLVLGDAGAAPFSNESFDIIICSQVYEHTPSLPLLIQEIQRLLKPTGVCFFSGPNRWAIMEEHYHLPFLSWLPKQWADFYVRWSGRAQEYYEHPTSAIKLRKAFAKFHIYDLTSEMLKNPEQYAMGPEVGVFKYLAQLIPNWLWSALGHAVPNFNWILVKAK